MCKLIKLICINNKLLEEFLCTEQKQLEKMNFWG